MGTLEYMFKTLLGLCLRDRLQSPNFVFKNTDLIIVEIIEAKNKLVVYKLLLTDNFSLICH